MNASNGQRKPITMYLAMRAVLTVQAWLREQFDKEEGHIADDYQLALATQRVF